MFLCKSKAFLKKKQGLLVIKKTIGIFAQYIICMNIITQLYEKYKL